MKPKESAGCHQTLSSWVESGDKTATCSLELVFAAITKYSNVSFMAEVPDTLVTITKPVQAWKNVCKLFMSSEMAILSPDVANRV